MTWDNYKDVMRSSRKKIRRVKVQLQLDLAVTLKNKDGFYKYVVDKRRLKDCDRHLLNV